MVGNDGAAVLDRQRRQMGVVDQVAACPYILEQPSNDPSVIRRRFTTESPIEAVSVRNGDRAAESETPVRMASSRASLTDTPPTPRSLIRRWIICSVSGSSVTVVRMVASCDVMP